MYKIIEAEVPGGMGKQTIRDTSTHLPKVERLHFEFEGWLGDDLIETFPCYLVTERLRDGILSAGLQGVIFDDVIISTSILFNEIYPGRQLPVLYWMKINGGVGRDDFAITNDHRLLVSEKAFNVLQTFNLNYAEVSDYVDE